MKDLAYEAQFEKINNKIKAINSPMLIVLIGLPGSGKSFVAKRIAKDNDDVVVVSSDAIRKEFYGDANDQSHNDKVFNIVNKQIILNLKDNKNVCYDATNLSKKRRKEFIKKIRKNFSSVKIMAIAMAVPKYLCKKRDAERDRHVGSEVIDRMLMNWCPPHYTEGFDFISIFYDYGESANFYNPILTLESAINIDHDNPHHSLTIGKHMLKAGELIQEEFNNKCPFYLYAAALLHDCGKPYVKFYGEDGVAHYYNHQNYGAYLGLFYADYMKFSLEETLNFINIIYYHMEPLLSWKRSEKAHARAIEELGSLYNDIMEVHKVDVASH